MADRFDRRMEQDFALSGAALIFWRKSIVKSTPEASSLWKKNRAVSVSRNPSEISLPCCSQKAALITNQLASQGGRVGR